MQAIDAPPDELLVKQVLGVYSFHLTRCDRIVSRVFAALP